MNWRVKRFGLGTKEGWLEWLGSDHLSPIPNDCCSSNKIEEAIRKAWQNIILQKLEDQRKRVLVTANLTLDAGLLVRSPGTEAGDADATHINSGGRAVLPGTSLAGVLRARALRIARVVRNGKGDAETWVDNLFGPRLKGTTNPEFQPHASRLKISEKPVEKVNRLRPNRIKIDRFTGGVVDGALFDEEPVYGGQTKVILELRSPKPGETGMVLLLLKDLLTGDLPVGGTSSVGRGILKGTAMVTINDSDYTLNPNASADCNAIQALNAKVKEFHKADSLAARSGAENVE